MGQVQNYNLYVRLSSQEKLLGILCVGSTDSVKVAIAFNYLGVDPDEIEERKIAGPP